MNTQKYGRTYHYPFSPGTTSDDRINSNYWIDFSKISKIIHTEKLDGENNCLNKYGVFARSHAAPTTSKWTSFLREKWNSIKNDLNEIEIFGENLYAIHSIEYKKIENYFYVFAVRENGVWLSWDEVVFYADFFDFPTVPILKIISNPSNELDMKQTVLDLASKPSDFISYDTKSNTLCTIEGIVSRNYDSFSELEFKNNVFKYVRKNHVKTDEHWTKNWKRAKLIYEFNTDKI